MMDCRLVGQLRVCSNGFGRQLARASALTNAQHIKLQHPTTLKLLPSMSIYEQRRGSSPSALSRQGNVHHAPLASKSRKPGRPVGMDTSLRRAVEDAQGAPDRTRPILTPKTATGCTTERKTVTAFCAAEGYNMTQVNQVLQAAEYKLDPKHTGLSSQVVHFQAETLSETFATGDLFVFPSGTVVAWNVPDAAVQDLITRVLHPAATNPHLDELETEHLEYTEDEQSSKSSVTGDVIRLGLSPTTTNTSPSSLPPNTQLTLTKIAFSSGLARSAKLAVLERTLERYFASTRSMLAGVLSRAAWLPLPRRGVILRKTGELFAVRARLNLYSELTDSLPDLFWESRAELGLEGNLEQVSRALDVPVRIRILNQKLDYAAEFAAVLRDRLSESRAELLEWLIIALISVEVAFEIARLYRERAQESEREVLNGLMQRYYQRRLDEMGPP